MTARIPCRAKAHWADASSAMRKAREYELRYCYMFEWYQCDECSQYHLRTRRHNGIKVLSLEAIQREGRGR